MTAKESHPKRDRFAQEYLVDLNATQAAIRAGYSKNGASVTGTRLLADARIQAKISELRGKVEKRTDITIDRVLREYARLAFFDPRRLFDAEGNPIPISELDDDTAAAIAGLEVERVRSRGDDDEGKTETSVIKYKITQKTAALQDIAKHLGMFIDRLELSGSTDLIERLTAGRRRLAESK
jgi:phage terminase small subunit